MAYKALEARTPSERMTALVLDIAELEAQLGKYGKISDEVLVAAIAERGSNERSVYIAQRRREVPEDLPEAEEPARAKAQEPQPSSPPSSSPPHPTETKPAQPEAKKTSAKDSEANPAAPASNPSDSRAQEIRTKRVRGAYARRKHKRGGERCVQEILRQKGKEQIEDLSDVDLKVLLDALDKLAEADEGHGGGGGW